MVTAAKPAIESFSFDGEIAGVAGAAALRKVRSLADAAPQGRLFAAISTLSDTSAAAAEAFEAAGLADLRTASEHHLARGNRIAGKLHEAIGADTATPLPAFMRRK
ncbi:MAG: hypothetical protein U1E15_09870 [Hyphomicrobiales bacterium]